MNELTFTLVTDGSSDDVLLPILTWLLRVNGVTGVPDPKAVLHDRLRRASGLHGRRLRTFPVGQRARRVAELIADFSPLRALPAFRALETDVQTMVREFGWAHGERGRQRQQDFVSGSTPTRNTGSRPWRAWCASARPAAREEVFRPGDEVVASHLGFLPYIGILWHNAILVTRDIDVVPRSFCQPSSGKDRNWRLTNPKKGETQVHDRIRTRGPVPSSPG
mgnify:CR=1 FL=1